MDRKIVIIPTYNEKENIEKIIRAVFSLDGEYHILVIEDGSPDGTAQIVRRLQEEFPDRLHMIERKGKLGLGTAYITGFKWSVENGYDYILKWMQTSRTILTTFHAFMKHAPKTEQTSQSALVIATESASSTGL
jgi:GT2 family glycosyltransferase